MSQADELLAILRDGKFRRGIEDWACRTWSLAQGICSGDVEGFEDLKDDWGGALDMAMNTEGWPESLFGEVVQKLVPPRPISAQDLAEGFVVYLEGNDDRICGEFDDVYESFLDHVRYRLLAPHSVEFEVCGVEDLPDAGEEMAWWYVQFGAAIGKAELLGTSPEIPVVSDDDDGTGRSEPVVPLGNEVELRFSGVRRSSRLRTLASVHSENHGILLGSIGGRLSDAALNSLQADVVPLLRSVIRSVRALRTPESTTITYAHLPTPTVRLVELQEHALFISECVRALFAPAGRKDTLDRRIANAARLLSEADGQTSDAIKLALSITAIEALLGKKGADISKTLTENVAVLLEPVPSTRSKAVDFVVELYDRRSRTLHGETLTNESSLADQARTLAAGCLYGLWFRNDFLARLGEKRDTPDALLKELKDRRWDGTRPDGVPELAAVRKLWAP